MKLRTRTHGVLAAACAAGAFSAVLAAGPAHAETASYDDPADATVSLTDIRTVDVDHGAAKVRVVVGFTDLRRSTTDGPSGLMIALDTDPASRGPEYHLTTGLQEGTDYQLLRVRHGRVVGEPLSCQHRVRLGFPGDRMVFRAARSCFKDPDRVRIAVKMRDESDGSHPVVDWLGAPRSFTGWLASA